MEVTLDTYQNPGDSLQESMSHEEYVNLMEETDAMLPNVKEMYGEWISIEYNETKCMAECDAEASAMDINAETDIGMEIEGAEADVGMGNRGYMICTP